MSGYVPGTRVLGVEVEQDNGVDLSGSTTLPVATATVAGLVTLGGVDGRVAPFARQVSPSGTIPTARLPGANALDSELPSANELVPTSGTTGHALTKTAAGRAWESDNRLNIPIPIDMLLSEAAATSGQLYFVLMGMLMWDDATVPLSAANANPAGMAVDTNGDWLVVDAHR